MSQRWRPHSEPWVIAHRGASGLLPEHTLPAYALAIEQGADVIEPDLVASADGVLHARHDLGLARSTDVASHRRFAGRRRRDEDGVEDWWIADFTAAELATLRARQPWPQRPRERDGCYRLPYFAQVLDLLLLERRRRERPLLAYPELKHPEYFAARGIDVVACLAAELEARDLIGADAPLLVQCFDRSTLHRVRERTGLRTVLLANTLPAVDTPGVDGFGIAKAALATPEGRAFVRAAHAAGRMVHAWTYRDDQPVAGRDPLSECRSAYAAGLDGLFSDFPATALAARRAWRAGELRIECLSGAAITPWLPALAALRIRVFRDWPYLYDGDAAYESAYLRAYAASSRSLVVLACDGDEVVGCSTATALTDVDSQFRAPFQAAGIDPESICYFGESVLDPRYRGRGLGHRFFDEREAHARALGYATAAFCAVQRAADDPRRPITHRPLDEFWRARGYQPQPHLVTEFAWRELDDPAPRAHRMQFWTRELS